MDSKVEIFVLTFHVQILHVFLNVHVLYCIVSPQNYEVLCTVQIIKCTIWQHANLQNVQVLSKDSILCTYLLLSGNILLIAFIYLFECVVPVQKHDFFERYIHYIKQIYSYAQNFAYIQKVYFYNSISVVLMQRNGTRTEDYVLSE